MTRGNQRDTDRKKREKDLKDKKHKNNMSGAEFQRTKEAQAAIMQEKQRKAEEKKATEAAKK